MVSYYKRNLGITYESKKILLMLCLTVCGGLVAQRHVMCVSCCLCATVFSLLTRLQKQAINNMVIVEAPTPRYIFVPGSFSCPFKYYRGLDRKQNADFHWSKDYMSALRQLTWYAEWFTMLPAGVYADLYGGRSVLTLGLLLSAVIYSFLPHAVYFSYYIFSLLLLLLTFCYGMVLPATSSIIARCAAPNERTTFIGMVHSGINLGVILGDIVSKEISEWDSLLYLNSGVAFVSAAIWYGLSRCQPAPTQAASNGQNTTRRATMISIIQNITTYTQF